PAAAELVHLPGSGRDPRRQRPEYGPGLRRAGRAMMRRLCGRALMAAVVVLAVGCGGDGKAELPDKPVAPPRGAPAPMEMPPIAAGCQRIGECRPNSMASRAAFSASASSPF